MSGGTDGGSVGTGEASAQEAKTLADADWVAEFDRGGTEWGPMVSDAGDVNGDGFADVIVGSAFYQTDAGGEGRALVFHGSESGLEASPSWTVDSDTEGSYLGQAVSGAGDVNADGFDDVLVAAPSKDDSGQVYLYLGSETGLQTSPAWTAESTQEHTTYGKSVSRAGDVNGDGYDDVIVGDPFYDGDFQNSGRAHVYLGSEDGLQADPVWIGDPGANKTAFFGWSVSAAGDVNGDGYDDIVIGESRYSNEQEREGRAHVFYGSASGVQETAAWTTESDLEEVEYGRSVSGAGDVNGDGFDDIIASARVYPDEDDDTSEGAYAFYSEPPEAPEPGSDAGTGDDVDAGDAGADTTTRGSGARASSGCGCSSAGAPQDAGAAILLFALLGFIRLRRR
ncbi:MAG: FG-GAP-like repeat-containing protein [Persicimonas sp.]